MAQNIQTITDAGQYQDIFYQYFMNGSVFIKTKSGDLKIEFFGYSDGLAAFRINFIKNISDRCLVMAKGLDTLVYVYLKFAEKQDDNLYLFYPEKIQVIGSTRSEDRKVVGDTAQSKKIIYIVNVISDFIIENCVAMSHKQVDLAKEIVKYDLEKHFQFIKTFFINEGMSDPRMRYFMDVKEPIMIPNVLARQAEGTDRALNYYINTIYAKDYYLSSRRELISEVSVPILYKGKIPYGYIQINHKESISESACTIIKRKAVFLEDYFQKHRVFPPGEDKLLVSDISKKGIGIVFNERRAIRYFKEGSLVYFELMLPDNKKSSILAVVKHLRLQENKTIKVGCEIRDIDALSEVYYDEFLDSLGIPND